MFEQTLGDCEGQGSLECCSPWGHNLATKQQQQQQHIFLFCNFAYQKKYENKLIFQVMKYYCSAVLCLYPTKEKSLNVDIRI